MNTKVWYLPYFEGVYRTRMIETYANANARMVIMIIQRGGTDRDRQRRERQKKKKNRCSSYYFYYSKSLHLYRLSS